MWTPLTSWVYLICMGAALTWLSYELYQWGKDGKP